MNDDERVLNLSRGETMLVVYDDDIALVMVEKHLEVVELYLCHASSPGKIWLEGAQH